MTSSKNPSDSSPDEESGIMPGLLEKLKTQPASVQNTLNNLLNKESTNKDETTDTEKFKKGFLSSSTARSGRKLQVSKSKSSSNTEAQGDLNNLFEKTDFSPIPKASLNKSSKPTVQVPKKLKIKEKEPTKSKIVSRSIYTPKALKPSTPTKKILSKYKVNLSSDSENEYSSPMDKSPDNLTKISDPDPEIDISPPNELSQFEKDVEISLKESLEKTLKKHSKRKPKQPTKKPVKKVIKPKSKPVIKPKTKLKRKAQNEVFEDSTNILIETARRIAQQDTPPGKRIRLPDSLFTSNPYYNTRINYKYEIVNGLKVPSIDKENPILITKGDSKPKVPKKRNANSNKKIIKRREIKKEEEKPFSYEGWVVDNKSGSEIKMRIAQNFSFGEKEFQKMTEGIQARVVYRDSDNKQCIMMKIKSGAKTETESSEKDGNFILLSSDRENSKAEITIGDNTFVIGRNTHFTVAGGNEYSIKNLGKEDANFMVYL